MHVYCYHSHCALCTYKKVKSWCILLYVVTMCAQYSIVAILFTISLIYFFLFLFFFYYVSNLPFFLSLVLL